VPPQPQPTKRLLRPTTDRLHQYYHISSSDITRISWVSACRLSILYKIITSLFFQLVGQCWQTLYILWPMRYRSPAREAFSGITTSTALLVCLHGKAPPLSFHLVRMRPALCHLPHPLLISISCFSPRSLFNQWLPQKTRCMSQSVWHSSCIVSATKDESTTKVLRNSKLSTLGQSRVQWFSGWGLWFSYCQNSYERSREVSVYKASS
jgi:hypothetical protein